MKFMTEICTTIIFSKDRPMQLDLTLRTYSNHCLSKKIKNKIIVLYKTSDENYERAYDMLIKEWHPNGILFKKEYDFKSDLIECCSGSDFITFVTDDTIFTNDFDLDEITHLLKHNTRTAGFSLRLGLNTVKCFALNCDNAIPSVMDMASNILLYSWSDHFLKSQDDFSYPMELSSSVYCNRSFLENAINEGSYSNPNTLEDILYKRIMQSHFYSMPFLMMYKQSCAFSNPLNIVQNTHPNNRNANAYIFSPTSLLNDFFNGYRIDASEFENYVSNGCHELKDVNYAISKV